MLCLQEQSMNNGISNTRARTRTGMHTHVHVHIDPPPTPTPPQSQICLLLLSKPAVKSSIICIQHIYTAASLLYSLSLSSPSLTHT